MRVTVVIPVFNECGCIDELVERVNRSYPDCRILFVDNASSDGTLDRIAQHDVDLVRHVRNEGYGKSIHDGVLKAETEVVVTLDGDLEYAPECIPDLVAALTEQTRVVYGSRFLQGRSTPAGVAKRAGNAMVTVFFNLLYGQNLTDLYTGIKAFYTSELTRFEFRRTGFDYVVEMAAYLSRSGQLIREVPVCYEERKQGQSKMKHFSETLKALQGMLLFRFLPMRTSSM